jgi:hypothetical protein
MFVKLQMVLANISKKNLILGGIHLLFTINFWIKKSQRDEYPKYLMGITCYYSLLIFG